MGADARAALRVFLSYRREDTSRHAAALYEQLVERLGGDAVFMDVGTLRGGEDFVDAIDAALSACDVVVALIGPRWLSAARSDGERRLDRSDDWVRIELGRALSRPDVRVVPVLVDGATMPGADELPEPLAALARRHAIELSPEEGGDGLLELLGSLERGKLGTNLPVPATSFLGREDELAELPALLQQDDVSLLTLTGPGGTGKTRLALEVGRRLLGRFEDGVWWVALAPLRDAQLVGESIAHVLGTKGDLVRDIGDRHVLLVLDNLEHVLDAAADVAALASQCPRLTILGTSRERLGAGGEQVYPVLPLAPEDGTELFLARARAASPGLVRDDGVAELCERLDNLPLALELAAARSSLFSPKQLLERVSERLDLLRARTDADPRQQTLRATIAWSHDLLDPREQRLFAMLSVFSGGCTYEAAEKVAAADPDTLQSLIEKSLVRRRDTDRGSRYWMLETVREFAEERLREGSGEGDGPYSSHADHFLGLAERAEPELRGSEQAAWLACLEAEQPNMRAALEWSLTRRDADRAVRLVAALGFFWYRHSYLAEGRRWIERALELGGDPASRATALNALGNLFAELRDNDSARASYEEALTGRRALGDLRGAAMVLNNLGTIAWEEHDWAEAERCFAESMRYFREIESDWDVALGLGNLASLALARGDLDSARQHNEEALLLRRGLGDDHGIASSLFNLALVGLEQRRLDEAERQLVESMEIAERLGDSGGTAELVEALALVAAARRDGGRAGRLLTLADALRTEIGSSLTSMSTDRRARYIEPERARDPVAFETGRREGLALAKEGAARAAAAECRIAGPVETDRT